MIEVTIFLGASFDAGQEYDTFNLPAVPQAGAIIRNAEGARHLVQEVEFFLRADRTADVRVLVKSVSEYDYSTSLEKGL